MSGFKLLRSVYYLCQLGHFPSAPLEQLLQSSTMEQFNNTRKMLNSHTQTHIRSYFFLCTWVFECQLPLFLLSNSVSSEAGENVSDGGLVPPPWPSSSPPSPDYPPICAGKPHTLQYASQPMALAVPAEYTGRPGRHKARGNGDGGELLLHR